MVNSNLCTFPTIQTCAFNKVKDTLLKHLICCFVYKCRFSSSTVLFSLRNHPNSLGNAINIQYVTSHFRINKERFVKQIKKYLLYISDFK